MDFFQSPSKIKVESCRTEDLSCLFALPNRKDLIVTDTSRSQLSRLIRLRGFKRNAGKLKDFFDLPLDIIYEVVGFLHPQDLLNISRLSKQVRSMMLGRLARTLWHRVLQQFPGLPKCPSHMNEPEYASYLFEKHCMACGVICKRPLNNTYALCLRLCPNCMLRNAVTGHDLTQDKVVFTLLLPLARSGTLITHKRAGADVSTEKNYSHSKFLRCELELVIQQYSELKERGIDKGKVKEVIQKQQSEVTAMMLHDRNINLWLVKYRSSLVEEKDRLGKLRHSQILEKMEKMGWSKEYYPKPVKDQLDLNDWNKILYLKRELTKTGWSRLHPRLEAIYNRVKDRRLQEARQTQVAQIEKLLSLKYFLFHINQVLAMPDWSVARGLPSISAILEDISVFEDTSEFWTSFEKGVFDDVRDYRERVEFRTSLIAALETHSYAHCYSGKSLEETIVLASTLFTCRCAECWEAPDTVLQLHGYPDVMDHGLYKWQECSFSADQGIRYIAETVLRCLSLSTNAPRSEVAGFSGKLICKCGHPDFQGPLSFESLVCHIYNEQSWYQNLWESVHPTMISSATRRLFDDHAINRISGLISVEKQLTSEANGPMYRPLLKKVDSDEETWCLDCWSLTQGLSCRVDARNRCYHMRAKHRKEVEDEGNVVAQWVCT